MSRRFSKVDTLPIQESNLFKKEEVRNRNHQSTKILGINIIKDKNENKDELKDISLTKRNSIHKRDSLLTDITSNLSTSKKTETKFIKKKKEEKKRKKEK